MDPAIIYPYGNGYMCLPVAVPELAATIEFKGKTFHKKTKFHVSLVCVKCIALLYEKLGKKTDEELVQEVMQKFAAYVEERPIAFLGFMGEFRHAIRDEDESIVAVCEVSNLTDFFDELNRDYGTDIPYQPTHVTLYTLKPNVGIGIPSQKQMDSYEKVTLPDINAALLEGG